MEGGFLGKREACILPSGGLAKLEKGGIEKRRGRGGDRDANFDGDKIVES